MVNCFLLEGTNVQIIEEMDQFVQITMLIKNPRIESRKGKLSQDRVTIYVPSKIIQQFKYKFDTLFSFGVKGYLSPTHTGEVHLIASSFRYMGGFINEWR